MILDTNAVSAILGGEEAIAAILDDVPRHHLPVVVLGEYLYGLKRSRSRKRIERWLFTLEDECEALHIDRYTALHYADIRDELRGAGKPIPENDVWIAALARQHRLPIVSRDQHFDAVSGIRRIGWEPESIKRSD
jgi:tRNA(fMet)-specific endonuclease VapC